MVPIHLGARRAVQFVPPCWATTLQGIPTERLQLGHFPTPLVRWEPLGASESAGREFWLKRDDLSGMELSGNKVRKLEFLMADALRRGADCVVTAGGLQSNHCRAVAVAARSLGLDSQLILRLEDGGIESAADACAGVGLSGNLLLKRMMGARISLVTRGEYRRHGSPSLIEQACERLRARGRRPYAIPVGGSDAVGTWGYIDAFEELRTQARELLGGGEGFSDIVIATGSGGSLAGLALANRLSGMRAKLWAFGACDSPAWFHGFIDRQIYAPMLPRAGEASGLRSAELAEVIDAKNLGYAKSAPEELRSVHAVAQRTGVVFDPVYSGKALHGFLGLMQRSPDLFGRRVLFWHTGGIFGLWDKQAQLQDLLDAESAGSGYDEPGVAPFFPTRPAP